MPSDDQIEVYKQHRAAQDKYNYFLLAAAGAAVALAVNQTHGAKLTWSQIPLAAAVLLWGFSFFFGCLNLAYVTATLHTNAESIKVKSGEHPLFGRDLQAVTTASEMLRGLLETKLSRAAWYGRWQFRTLICGGVAYLGWHVYEMWLRTWLPTA